MALIIWGDRAKDDLRRIVIQIEQDSPTRAQKWLDKLITAPKRLAVFPGSCALVEGFEEFELRELLVGPYRILYRFRDDICRIVAVIHSKRDLIRVLDTESLL